MLLLANPDPLVVDQPEDNLDNAFIAERIVRELRDAKTKRRFVFSTHNANVPYSAMQNGSASFTAERTAAPWPLASKARSTFRTFAPRSPTYSKAGELPSCSGRRRRPLSALSCESNRTKLRSV